MPPSPFLSSKSRYLIEKIIAVAPSEEPVGIIERALSIYLCRRLDIIEPPLKGNGQLAKPLLVKSVRPGW